MFIFNINIIYSIVFILIVVKILTIEREKKAIHYFFENYNPKRELLRKNVILENLNHFINDYINSDKKCIIYFHKKFESIISKLYITILYENLNENHDYRKIKNEVFVRNLLFYFTRIFEFDCVTQEELKQSIFQNIIEELSSINIENIFILYRYILSMFDEEENTIFNFLKNREKINISYHRLQLNSLYLEKYISYIRTKNPNYIH